MDRALNDTGQPAAARRPPIIKINVLAWMKANLFNGWFNSLLTLVVLYLLWKIVPPLIEWAFIDSLWTAAAGACQQSDGACWSVIAHNFRFIIFGFYPYDQHLRPLIAMLLLFGLIFYSRDRKRWRKSLMYYWILGLATMGILMKGGIFGLQPVETTKWGGLPLTLLLSVFGLTAAYPLGVILALGRQSTMNGVRRLCVVYIELIRGVPLISLLFMSSIIFPLFLPEGLTINKILRAQVAIILFTAAYIAEVVRGGLQGMHKGQYEAADSLGAQLLPGHALDHPAPGPENGHPAHGQYPDFRLQGYLPGGDHRSVRRPQDVADGPFRSEMDGLQSGGLYIRLHLLLPGLFFHGQLQPETGTGVGYESLELRYISPILVFR